MTLDLAVALVSEPLGFLIFGRRRGHACVEFASRLMRASRGREIEPRKTGIVRGGEVLNLVVTQRVDVINALLSARWEPLFCRTSIVAENQSRQKQESGNGDPTTCEQEQSPVPVIGEFLEEFHFFQSLLARGQGDALIGVQRSIDLTQPTLFSKS